MKSQMMLNGARVEVLPSIGGGIEEIKKVAEIWRSANASQKKSMAETWESVMHFSAKISAKYNIPIGILFGKYSKSDNCCEKCHGTGYFVKWKFDEIREMTCNNCYGTGHLIARCKKCQGTGYIDDDPCPICDGRGYFIYYKKTCPVCGQIAPTGKPIKGKGVIIQSVKQIDYITPCNHCGGWGSLHPSKNPYMEKA